VILQDQSKGPCSEIHQVLCELSLVPDRCDPSGCVWSEPCSASTFHARLQFIGSKNRFIHKTIQNENNLMLNYKTANVMWSQDVTWTKIQANSQAMV
jgi:hypothetical protein